MIENYRPEVDDFTPESGEVISHYSDCDPERLLKVIDRSLAEIEKIKIVTLKRREYLENIN